MIIMKTIASALLALTVLASVAAPASAEFFYGNDHFDARQFFEYLQNRGG
jgi:hypothetical protein